MIRISVAILLALSASLGTGFAQHAQPYAGLQNRVVKALSEQQMADLRAGRGMGLALAAELNGYPGPLHVIELRRELALNDAQAARAQALFDAMKAETSAWRKADLRGNLARQAIRQSQHHAGRP